MTRTTRTVSPATVTTHRLSSAGELGTAGSLDVARYSRMKHGDVAAARSLAEPLGRRLLDAAPELGTDAAPVLFPVAYMSVRPSCWFLAQAVCDTINGERARRGLQPGGLVRIAKDAVTTTDYANATAEQRTAELQRIGFRLDDDVHGAHLVVVDDIRVTGTAERTILAPLLAGGPRSVHVAYLAVVTGSLADDPTVEARLNHAAVASVTDLIPTVRRGDFALTIRFLKRLLAADHSDRAAFLSACTPALLDELVHGATTSGPDVATRYAEAISDLVVARQGSS